MNPRPSTTRSAQTHGKTARVLLLLSSWALGACLLTGADGGCGGPPSAPPPSAPPDSAPPDNGAHCEGEALPCTSYFDPTCNLQEGCTFAGTEVFGDCVGSATPCEDLMGEDTCLAQEGCQWQE